MCRAGGVLAVWLAYGLLLGPATYLASFVPLLGGLVGWALSLVALGAALAHALSVIALAWLAHRPAIALALLAAVAGLLWLTGAQLSARKQSRTSSSSTKAA